MRIRFKTGAQVVVEAPARLKADGSNALTLLSGKLTAVVPPAAHGFTVTCPGATVVDLGTEFGVNVRENGLSDVDVFKGTVSLSANSPLSARANQADDKPLLLGAGSARRISADNLITAIDSNPAAYFRQTDFDRLQAAPPDAALVRWRGYSEHLRDDPDLVAYYTFERSTDAPDRLLNRSSAGSSLDGALGDGDANARPQWSTGRWPGKGALTFLPGTAQHVSLPANPAFDFSRGGRDSRPSQSARGSDQPPPGLPAAASSAEDPVFMSNTRSVSRPTEESWGLGSAIRANL